jgi:hypothetical protein
MVAELLNRFSFDAAAAQTIDVNRKDAFTVCLSF